jgi:hypothetical protein
VPEVTDAQVATNVPFSSSVSPGRYCVLENSLFTTKGAPFSVPSAFTFCAVTPVPLPSMPLSSVQITVNEPSARPTTSGSYWLPLVTVLTRNSPPCGAPLLS